MPKRDSLKQKQIDRLDFKSHLLLLAIPMLLLTLLYMLAFPADNMAIQKLVLICTVYLIGYVVTYAVHRSRLKRLWKHLEQVIDINDTTNELVHLSSHYHSEKSFLDALLSKAVDTVDDAEMGSIIIVDQTTKLLRFESVIGLNVDELSAINFSLEETFEYRLTNGRCDRVVVINDMENINSGSTLSKKDQETLLGVSKEPIRSTLSSPIHIDGQLYAMMNLDSSKADAFGDYDTNLVNILMSEASNAIALYQKSKKIERLANYDGLTEIYNRKKFDASIADWQQKTDQACFVVVIDIDKLKPLNDEFGHQAGDYSLKVFAQHLKNLWHPQHLVARYGGDEFVALCHGPADQLDADVQQLQDNLLKLTPPIHFSYGIAEYHLNWAKSFKEADLKMYNHKRNKKAASND